MAKSERIALRLESEVRRKAEQLIEAGKYRNLSQIVREALTEFLAKNKPLDDMLREAFAKDVE
ncbi:MAG: hypothetical protein ACPLVJ_01275 [Candidatus Bathyarchaeales archaeon]